ncbi:hypothetical protein V6Z11_A02G048300 [Gossypium hirsutum]
MDFQNNIIWTDIVNPPRPKSHHCIMNLNENALKSVSQIEKQSKAKRMQSKPHANAKDLARKFPLHTKLAQIRFTIRANAQTIMASKRCRLALWVILNPFSFKHNLIFIIS